MTQRKKNYKAADAAHPEKEESPRSFGKITKKEAPHGKIKELRSAFQQGILVPLKAVQLELTHYCGKPMSILIDGDSPGDPNYRTWAWCKDCKQMGLIHEGKWLDPRVASEAEWAKGTGSVQ